MADNEDLRKYMERMGGFIKNRQAFPQEELAKYSGQSVAWSPDGTRIVAASPNSLEEVWDAVVAAGYDPHECVFSYVPADGELFI
jgi:hypothetical protein